MTDSDTSHTPPLGKQRMARFWHKAKQVQMLYLLVLPTTLIIAVLGYYPKIDVIFKSMYRWNPPDVEEFVGLQNFVDIFADNLFWQSFQLVFILLIANLFKMWPGIFAAVALHRITNEKLRYRFQVCFVIPMVIPGMVWLLIWKSFYDPTYGVLNRFMNATGLMRFFHFLDGSPGDVESYGLMPRIARFLGHVHPETGEATGIIHSFVEPVFGGTWGLVLLGAFFLTLAMHGPALQTRVKAGILIVAAAALPVILILIQRLLQSVVGGPTILGAGLVAFTVLMFVLAKTLGPKWVLWMFYIFGGLIVFRENYLYLFLLPLAAILISEGIRFGMERFASEGMIKTIGAVVLVFGFLLIAFGQTWTEPTGQFEFGAPAWLGNQDLVIPALLFWGFPWVGTMGVLIYLAGLQQIPQDVYEAAEIDGIGPLGMLFKIELPLILTQVRINLIFMTIGTLVSYEMFLILLGPSGGPGNRGMVPGLYMFSKAFMDGQFGYASALGMVLFFLILGLTIIYQKYVKVDK